MTVPTLTVEHQLLVKIAAAQREMMDPKKGSTVTTPKYTHKFASLEATMEVVEPVLEKYKLGHIVIFESREISYLVFDLETGHGIKSNLELPLDNLDGNVWQQIGQGFTYLRRYLAQAFWQLIPEDDDAQGAPQRSKPTASRTQSPQSKAHNDNDGEVL